MKTNTGGFRSALRLLLGSLFLLAMAPALGQVSPVDILNPRLKAREQEYLPQLQSLQRSIAAEKFSYPFVLARYLNAKPGQRGASNSNGIEFVYFQSRVVLKVSGFYKAAFNATQLSRNERAGRTFEDVVTPVLRLVAQQIPRNAACDGIGFEIIYNTRDVNKAYDYEGQEVLAVVLSRDDAFAYANASGDAERQQILNRSDIFVNGKDFGLALGQRDPLDVEALERSDPREAESLSPAASIAPNPPAAVAPVAAAVSGPVPVPAAAVVPHPTPALVAAPAPASGASPASATAPLPVAAPAAAVSAAAVSPVASGGPLRAGGTSPPTVADALKLQTQFQAQLNAIVKEDGARLHLAERAGPSFGVDGARTFLHFTMQNSLVFEKGTTSIYKRAAQSFDLFLAPELRGLLGRLPADAQYDELRFSVLNRFGPGESPSETIDYICPVNSVRSFVENKITSQDLIDQSIVLVNGVRVALNLQLVE